jgi:uroporphyrinogen-III synthase
MASSTLPLAGRGIVITRPAGQAQALAALLAQNGAQPIVVPAIEIQDMEDRNALNAVIDRLDDYDLAIFISPNAAAKGCQAIRARRNMPSHLRVAAVGAGTAAAVKSLVVGAAITPHEGADSESLLRVPELQNVAGARIVIFRGVGGRELLRETLIARGAQVDYAECYRRVRPQIDVAPLLQSWSAGEIDAVVVTSSESLRNLHELLGPAGRTRLAMTPVFVSHHRIAETARELGMQDVVIAAHADEAVMSALLERFGHR